MFWKDKLIVIFQAMKKNKGYGLEYRRHRFISTCAYRSNSGGMGAKKRAGALARVSRSRPCTLAYKPQHIEWERGNGSSWPDYLWLCH